MRRARRGPPGRRPPAGLPALLLALALAGACGGGNAPEAVSRRFMDAYYVRADLGAAKGLAEGLASRKIEEQVALTRGQAVGGAAEGRSVAYTLVSQQAEGDRHSYLFHVQVRLKGGGEFTRRSIISVAQVEGIWRVTNFYETGP